MRLLLSALECDIDTSPRLPSNAAGIYIKMSLNGGCVVTLYKSNKAHRLNKMCSIPLIFFLKNYLNLPSGIKKLQLVSLNRGAYHLLWAATLQPLCPHIQPVTRVTSAEGFHSEMEIKTRAGSV